MKEYNGKYVTLMLCSQCNNNCKHCYIKYSGRFYAEELEILIPALLKKYKVILNGTEPIMFEEYFRFFKMVGEHRILTNGIELIKNPAVMKSLKANDINEVALSYHFGIQDDISMVKTRELNILIKVLKQNGFVVKLMCSLSKDNYENIEEYVDRAKKLGVDKIKFTNFINQGNAKNNYNEGVFLNQQEIDETLHRIDVLRDRTNKSSLNIQRCGTFGPNCEKSNFECLAGNNMVAITPDKRVYSCVFDINGDNNIGFLDSDNKIILNNATFKNDGSQCLVLRKYNNIGEKK